MIGAFGVKENYNQSYLPGALPGMAGHRSRRMGAPSDQVNQFMGWPTTGSVIVYGTYGPNAVALGGYTAGNGTGTIGQITGIVTDSINAQWYQVDTTMGSLPAMLSWPTVATNNIIYVPAFGDTSQPDFTQLTPAQAALPPGTNTSGTPITTTTSTTPGLANGGGTKGSGGGSGGGTGAGSGTGLLPGPGTGLNTLEKVGLSIFVGLLILVGINQATK